MGFVVVQFFSEAFLFQENLLSSTAIYNKSLQMKVSFSLIRRIMALIAIFLALCSCQDFDETTEMEAEFARQSMERQRDVGGVLCHSGMIAVQNMRPLESNGCTGADMIKLSGKEDFTYCCDLHDACYQTCGMTQKKCDADFKRCMMDMCSTTFSNNEQCQGVANLFHMATSSFGRNFYDDAQSEHCDCIDIRAKSVQARYKKLIDNFYSEYAPENMGNFDIKRYLDEYKGSPRKWGNLLYNLYAKYDHAIVHVGSRIAKKANIPRPATKNRGSTKDKNTKKHQKGEAKDSEEL